MGWCIRAPPRRRSGVRGIHSGALDGLGLSATAARAADRKIGSPELPTPACGCAAASARRRALGSRRAAGAARMSGTARWGDRELRMPSLRPGRLARLREVAPARRTALQVCRPPPVLARAGTGARGATSPCCPASFLGAFDLGARGALYSMPSTRHPIPGPRLVQRRLLEASAPQQRCGRHTQSHAARSAVGLSSALPPAPLLFPSAALPSPSACPPHSPPLPLTLP